MPVLSIKKNGDGLGGDSPIVNGDHEDSSPQQPAQPVSLTAPPKEPQQDSLLDLLSGDVTIPNEQPVTIPTEGNNLLDLLDSTPSAPPPGNTTYMYYIRLLTIIVLL